MSAPPDPRDLPPRSAYVGITRTRTAHAVCGCGWDTGEHPDGVIALQVMAEQHADCPKFPHELFQPCDPETAAALTDILVRFGASQMDDGLADLLNQDGPDAEQ